MNIKSIQIFSKPQIILRRGEDSKRNRSPDLEWCLHLLSDIESLLIFGGVHNIEHDCYRMLSKRFLYAIYYEINEEVVYIANAERS
jgi:hypothetical protein